MKTVVINLKNRKDRLDTFKENNLKYISYQRVEAINGNDIDYKKLTEIKSSLILTTFNSTLINPMPRLNF